MNFKSIILNAMWKHNIILAIRNFKRHKSSFLINLVGLSTGLTCALLIYLWVFDEINVDKFHQNDNRLYHVMQNFKLPNKISTWDITPALLGNALQEEIPEVEQALTISSREQSPDGLLIHQDKDFVTNGLFAGKNYLDVFSYPLLKGDKGQILENKNDIVISKKLALKLFGSIENVLGKTLTYKDNWMEDNFKVTGVFQEPPSNSTTHFDYLMSIDILMADEYASQWTGDYAKTYVILKEGTDPQIFNNKIADFLKKKHESRAPFTLIAQKYSDKYLHGIYENGVQVGGRFAYVKLFSIIAIFILIIACINFMNLSTAQASKKMKEIGVKKTMGVNRQTLITQFLSESTILVFLSLVMSLMAVFLLLPSFNIITGKVLQLNFDLNFILVLGSVLLLTGIISGSYPAFYLSGFNPVMVLKGKRIASFGEEWIRKGLVVFQFALSVIFIVGVMVVHQQMDFIQNKNLGYNRDNILSFHRIKYDDAEAFLNEVKKISGVESAANMYGTILDNANTQSGFSWRGQEEDRKYLFKSPIISYDILETFGMNLKAGQSFSKEAADNRSKIIINESAQKMMGLEDPIGKKIMQGNQSKEIIGVVNDFNYGSIHHKVEPLLFRYTSGGNNVIIKLKEGFEKTTIAQLEELYGKFYPSIPFKFSFIDDDYQTLYEAESKVAILSKYFSGLAIIISCLGLFGLAMFTTERRKKEIGIRKVLGSSVFSIVQMLTNDFTKIIIAAILISTPISFIIAKSWLTNFAYGIQLAWWLFFVPALLVLIIAWCTVGLQTVKAAQVNPVECLKNE